MLFRSSEWRISVVIAPEHRGHGLAAHVIGAGVRAFAAVRSGGRVIAEIRHENEPSRRAFESAGFEQRAHLADSVDLYEFAVGR